MNLLGTTGRQRLVAVFVAVLGLVVMVSVAVQQWSLGAAAGGLLLTGMALIALDLRRRSGDQQIRLVRQSESTRNLAKAIESSRRDMLESTGAIARDMQQRNRDLSGIEDAIQEERGLLADERRRNVALLRRIIELATDQQQEVEALIQLYSKVSPRAPMPPASKWALNPTGLLNLCALVEKHRPGLIVELGSGTSTVWLGYAVLQQAHGRVVSLDHLPDYAEHTRTMIDWHGLSALTDVRDAPLTDTRVGDDTYKWYDPAALTDLHQIDLLFVDGPPGTTGHEARYPALPMFYGKLADGALIVLDDIDREDEQEIVERWLKETPGLSRQATLVGDQAVLEYRVQPLPSGSAD